MLRGDEVPIAGDSERSIGAIADAGDFKVAFSDTCRFCKRQITTGDFSECSDSGSNHRLRILSINACG